MLGILALERDRQEVHNELTFQTSQASSQEPISKKKKEKKKAKKIGI